MWTSTTELTPSVVPKISLKNGLIYTFTEEQDPANPTTDVWSWAALDYRTGATAFKRIAGLGTTYNNHYAGIALGQAWDSARWRILLRAGGAAIGASGFWFVAAAAAGA